MVMFCDLHLYFSIIKNIGKGGGSEVYSKSIIGCLSCRRIKVRLDLCHEIGEQEKAIAEEGAQGIMLFEITLASVCRNTK